MVRVLVVLIVLLWGTEVAAQERHGLIMHGAIAGSFIAHGADLGTSMYAFGVDPVRFRESNPLLRPFSSRPIVFASLKMGMAVAINAGLLKYHEKHPVRTLVISCVQTSLVSYVAYHNQRQINQLRNTR